MVIKLHIVVGPNIWSAYKLNKDEALEIFCVKIMFVSPAAPFIYIIISVKIIWRLQFSAMIVWAFLKIPIIFIIDYRLQYYKHASFSLIHLNPASCLNLQKWSLFLSLDLQTTENTLGF